MVISFKFNVIVWRKVSRKINFSSNLLPTEPILLVSKNISSRYVLRFLYLLFVSPKI